MKKILCTLLAFAMCLTMVAFPASAEESARYIISPEVAGAETAVALTDDDLSINEEVAEYIAQFFVEDMMATGQTTWETEPTIVETVPMYDEYGKDITAYTIELSSGYVVVSAYIDVPNIILEWADETAPFFDSVETSSSKIIYTGGLNYFIDNGGTQVQTVDGDYVQRTRIDDILTPTRSAEYVSSKVIQEIVQYKQASVSVTRSNYVGDDNEFCGYITDPFIHAENLYGGSWTAYTWENHWEDYTHFAKTSDFSGYDEHCGIVANINLLRMYANKYGLPAISSLSDQTLFSRNIQINDENGGEYFDNGSGTNKDVMDDFVKKFFASYNVSITISSMLSYNFGSITNSLSKPYQLLYMALSGADGENGNPYADHGVIAYAYTQLKRTNLADYRTYVKLVDGSNSGPRYLEFIALSCVKYYAITF